MFAVDNTDKVYIVSVVNTNYQNQNYFWKIIVTSFNAIKTINCLLVLGYLAYTDNH